MDIFIANDVTSDESDMHFVYFLGRKSACVGGGLSNEHKSDEKGGETTAAISTSLDSLLPALRASLANSYAYGI